MRLAGQPAPEDPRTNRIGPIVDDKDVSDALEILGNEEGAAWRGSHNYLDALTKSILGKLMKEAEGSSAPMREAWARCQPEFTDHLKQLKEAEVNDYRWRQRYAAADAKIEIWRTLQANYRGMEKVR
jgi:hypothetical protein